MRPWRNRHTRTFEGRVGKPVRVQVSSAAPQSVLIWDGFFVYLSDYPRGSETDGKICAKGKIEQKGTENAEQAAADGMGFCSGHAQGGKQKMLQQKKGTAAES